MMKIKVLLVTLFVGTGWVYAQEETPAPPETPEVPEIEEMERPQMNGLEKQRVRLEELLADESLSDRKRAYLEHRAAIVDVQLRFRDALRDAKENLEGRERGEAVRAVREELNEELKELGKLRKGGRPEGDPSDVRARPPQSIRD